MLRSTSDDDFAIRMPSLIAAPSGGSSTPTPAPPPQAAMDVFVIIGDSIARGPGFANQPYIPTNGIQSFMRR